VRRHDRSSKNAREVSMSRWFAVIRTRGPGWDHAIPLREQPLWREHAAFVDGLEAEGVIRFAGPLEDGDDDVLLICRADSPEAVEARLAGDPWPGDMLSTSRIAPWNVLVGREELDAGA
jgi:uncharacterized protein YciI